MTNLEEALTQARPWPDGSRHALNVEARTRKVEGLLAELEQCEIRVSVATGGGQLLEIERWQDVAHLAGWRPA